MSRPSREQVRIFKRPGDFRRWLEKKHDRADEVFVGTYKKHVDKVAMDYFEAVDEALCFGWIDGIGYRIDDEIFAVRFSPRRPRSHWTETNVAKVEALQAAGRMHPAGMAAFEARR